MSNKKLYKGTFNYVGQNMELFKHTNSIDQAFFYMTRDIAKEVQTSHSKIKYYFGGMKDNYKIIEDNPITK